MSIVNAMANFQQTEVLHNADDQEIQNKNSLFLFNAKDIVEIAMTYIGVIAVCSLIHFFLTGIADFFHTEIKEGPAEEIAAILGDLIIALDYAFLISAGIAIVIKTFSDTWGAMTYSRIINETHAETRFSESNLNRIGTNTTTESAPAAPHQVETNIPTPLPIPTAPHQVETNLPTPLPTPPAPTAFQTPPQIPTSGNPTRRRLFDLMTNSGHNIGSFEHFDERMNTEEGRRIFYSHAQSSNIPIGNWDEFNSKMQ